ncbi:MAG: DUF3558 domain-containing protein [Umezawaea sp.]
MRSYRHLAAALVAVAFLAGCSAKTAGRASAGATTPSAAASATGQPSSSAKAPVTRPKKIDLKGVDSCSVLSSAQRQQFDFAREPTTVPARAYGDATLCSFSSSDFSYGLGVTVVANQGFDSYARAVEAGEATAIQVGGFPAAVNRFTALRPSCFIGLDVADGQFIELQVDSSKVPMDELCSRATKIADAIIQTISAK